VWVCSSTAQTFVEPASSRLVPANTLIIIGCENDHPPIYFSSTDAINIQDRPKVVRGGRGSEKGERDVRKEGKEGHRDEGRGVEPG